jgi:HlyD family secretion protein
LPSHVDGHHHVHVEPFVAAALATIMVREYGVHCVRLPQQARLDAMTDDAEFDMAFQQAVAAAASTARPLFAAHGIYSTAAFLGQSLMGTRLTAAAVALALHELDREHQPTSANPLSVELMVHPGVPASDVTSSAFCRSPARAHEMAVLQSAAWRSAIAGWQLDSYRALTRPTDSDDDRPSVLIYGKLTPATGNAETARRYEAAWSPLAHVRFRPVPNDITTSTRLAREALRLQEFAARERLDLALGIHLYQAGAPLAAAFANESLLPYGLLASGTDVNADIDDPARAASIAQSLQSAEFLLCLNAAQQARLKPFGLPADTRVLGNGIDVATDSRYSLRQTFGLSDTMQLVLFPASLRRLKGVLPTVEALAPLLASCYTSHVLVVLGPTLETDYAREVHEHIATLNERHPNLSGRIHLHDGLPHEDYLAALREADLVLNASEHEGLSHGIAEAMAAGIPVLARDIAGNRLLVRDGENGRLFTDFAALPGAYAACFADGEATRRLATQARIDIAAAHPADAEQQVLRDVLQTALARRQTSLTLPGTEALRLELAPGTHPVSAENAALFRSIALSPAAVAQLPETLELAIDAGCGCGVFGFNLLDALGRHGKRLKRMIFADPHQPSLAALGRTLRRHAQQLPMLESAMLSDGSLLQPLLDRDRSRQSSNRASPIPAPARSKPASAPSCRRSWAAASNAGGQGRRPVKKGQLLMKLWNDDQQAQSTLARRRWRLARSASTRPAPRPPTPNARPSGKDALREKGFVSARARKTARTEAEAAAPPANTAKADVAQAEARVKATRVEQGRTVLYAPFAGTVAKIVGEVGEYSTPSPPGVPTPPAIDLIDDSCLYVKAPMDEVDAPKISAGQPVRISLDALPGKQSFPGKVKRVAPYVSAVEKQARTVDIEATFDDPEAPASCWSATAPTSKSSSPCATTSCACRPRRCRKAAACWCRRDGKLEERTIKAGLANWEYTEVLEGLKAGDASSPRSNARGQGRRTYVVTPDETRATASDAHALIELAGIERVFQLGDSEVHALRRLTCASMPANTSR